MKYILNPLISMIESPMTLVLLDTGQRRSYESGYEASLDVFDRHYRVESIYVEDGDLVIEMNAVESIDCDNAYA